MVEVSVTASVKAAGGPSVPLGTTLEPESYTYASVDLDAAGGTAPTNTVALPDVAKTVLLALAAKIHGGAQAGTPAKVTVTLKKDEATTVDLHIDGALLIANVSVLEKLVSPDGPRSLTVENKGTDPVTVEVLACHSAS